MFDRAYVLDQGTNAHQGTGRELANDPKVIELYLGTLATDVESNTAAQRVSSWGSIAALTRSHLQASPSQ